MKNIKKNPPAKATSIRPTTRQGAYTSRDSVDYSKSLKRMEQSSAKMRFGKDSAAKKAGEMEFRKEQAALKSNPYSKAKSGNASGTGTKGLGPKPSAKKTPSRGLSDIFDIRDRGTSRLEKGMNTTRKKIEKKVTPIYNSRLGTNSKQKLKGK